jgi:hypothetical protein
MGDNLHPFVICGSTIMSNHTVPATQAIFKAFDRPRRSNIKVGSRVPNMPSFLDAESLQPFISEDLMNMINAPVKLGIRG